MLFLASRDPVRSVAIIDARSLWACAYSPLRPSCLENLSRAPRLDAVGDTTCTSGFPLFVKAAGDPLETCGNFLKDN